MTVLRGHFDGRVIVPDTPVDLPRGQELVIRVEPAEPSSGPARGTAEFIARAMENDRLSDEDAELLRKVIEEECERIDPPTAVDFG